MKDDSTIFAVLNPRCPAWRHLIPLIGTDVIPIYPRRNSDPKAPWIIRCDRLRSHQVTMLVRKVMRMTGAPEAVVFFDAMYGQGFSLGNHCLRITDDPKEGRAFIRASNRKRKRRKGKGGDDHD